MNDKVSDCGCPKMDLQKYYHHQSIRKGNGVSLHCFGSDMKEIIIKSFTSIVSIYLGILSGLLFDGFQRDNLDLASIDSRVGTANYINYEHQVMDHRWKSLSSMGRLGELLNLPGSNRCDLDGSQQCGGCVKL